MSIKSTGSVREVPEYERRGDDLPEDAVAVVAVVAVVVARCDGAGSPTQISSSSSLLVLLVLLSRLVMVSRQGCLFLLCMHARRRRTNDGNEVVVARP